MQILKYFIFLSLVVLLTTGCSNRYSRLKKTVQLVETSVYSPNGNTYSPNGSILDGLNINNYMGNAQQMQPNYDNAPTYSQYGMMEAPYGDPYLEESEFFDPMTQDYGGYPGYYDESYYTQDNQQMSDPYLTMEDYKYSQEQNSPTGVSSFTTNDYMQNAMDQDFYSNQAQGSLTKRSILPDYELYSPQMSNVTSSFSNNDKSSVPYWIKNHYNFGYVTVVGVGRSMMGGTFGALLKNSRLNAARKLNYNLRNSIANILISLSSVAGARQSSVFYVASSEIAMDIVTQALQFTKIRKMWINSYGTLFSLLSIETKFIVDQIGIKVRELFKEDQSMYYRYLIERDSGNVKKVLEYASSYKTKKQKKKD
jgi:hypothetical protein